MEDLIRKIEQANQHVIDHLQQTDPYWIGMKPAKECIPDVEDGMIFHSGPNIEWDRMHPSQQDGCINGALYEGYAKDAEEARRLFEKGSILALSANDYHIVGPGSGIATPSLVMNIVEDRFSGSRGFCAPFEGPNRGGLGGWGIYNPDVQKFLELITDVIAPAFTSVLEECDGLPLRRIFVRGVEMGDELHSRQDASGLIAVNEMTRKIFEADFPHETKKACIDLMYGTVRYFHPLGMASAMAALEGVRDVPYSTVVTAMEGNAVDFAVKIAGCGNEWFYAPSPRLHGALISSSIDENELLPWIGDSCMLEACGLGGFAAAAAPAVLRARKLTIEEGISQVEEMGRITLAKHPYYLIPNMDYVGTPLGIDMRKVIRTGIEPIIHGGMIGKDLRRVGAGAARVPLACFENALEGYVKKYDLEALL